MATRTLEADYLVVGSGAAGMAFVDSLIEESDAEVVIVDRRAAPGGHWNDAYPFVRLHQPSMYYGVNSLPLGDDAIESGGPERGCYERARGAEISAYYARVMDRRLLASGRVRWFPQWDHVGGHRIVSRLTGETIDVRVRRKFVDANYLSPAIPADTPAPYEVTDGVASIPVGRLTQLGERPERYVIVGSGKTAMDACVWLLDNGVDPDHIQWIRPRDNWVLNRRYAQPGALVDTLFEGISLQMESAANASSIDDLFERLEATGQMSRIDRSVRPTMYKAATIADWEVERLRRIGNVVRLGHVRRIERDRIVLDDGAVATRPGSLHVHCAANGLRRPPARPIFEAGRITLQPVRVGLVPFNAALVGFIETHRDDDAQKNQLCPPNPYPDTPADWVRGTLVQMAADRAWSQQQDLQAWLERSRLNPMRGLRSRWGEARVQQASRRFGELVRPALARMTALAAAA